MQHIGNIKVVKKTPSVGMTTSNKLLKSMYKKTSYGRTENDALTLTRSGNNVLDFFAQAGAMRKNPDKALDLFQKAFAEDRQLAVRVLFYLRDVRGGQGERTLFRNCLSWLGSTYPDVFEKLVDFVPEYGRWDDVFFDNVKCYDLIANQLKEDVKSEMPSLLAKWLPTVNASSATTRAKARHFIKALGMGEIEYRTMIRGLRKKIKTVEEKMSAQKWGEIDYSHVPSQASRIYKDAFKKHDEKRYGEFIGKAVKGEVKINASTLYPYQIYKDVESKYSMALEALWSQLPDYTRGKKGLVVADVSGSMSGDPMAVSVSLALYFAERNEGPFKDHFLTFSGNPVLQRVVGKTLKDRMNSIENAEWGMNTDLEKAVKLILNTAVANSVPAEDMPDTLYIISDMEFDACVSGKTLHEDIKEKYEAAGYKLPTIVFWNVDARSGRNVPVKHNEHGVALVSGFSPVIFKTVMENKSPLEVMLDTVNSERYQKIVLE
jgi:hypothetical protein